MLDSTTTCKPRVLSIKAPHTSQYSLPLPLGTVQENHVIHDMHEIAPLLYGFTILYGDIENQSLRGHGFTHVILVRFFF